MTQVGTFQAAAVGYLTLTLTVVLSGLFHSSNHHDQTARQLTSLHFNHNHVALSKRFCNPGILILGAQPLENWDQSEFRCSNPSCLFEPCCPRGYVEPSFRHSNHLVCVSTSAKSGLQKTTWFKPSSLFVNFPKNDIRLFSSQFSLKRQHGSNQVVYF